MAMNQTQKYETFLELHRRARGFIMPNAWDGLSAAMLRDAGFEALGTSSAAFASSLGRIDGSHAVSAREHLDHAALLGKMSDLPINGDFEDGYGETPLDVTVTVKAAIEAGLAGIGVEDTSANPAAPIREFDDAVARVKAAAHAAKGRIVLTARTDNFIQGRNDLDDTIRRLTAFAEVGADVLYAPYPPDLASVVKIIKAVAPTPVNVVVGPADKTLTADELLDVGVKRISMGTVLYTNAMTALKTAAASLMAGDIASASSGIGFREVIQTLKQAQLRAAK
jgi:2-methylisocitrate lyase-like PEP mutase family enzyme